MMRRLVFVVWCVVASACSQPSASPTPARATPLRHADIALTPVPFEAAGACPFEGCVYRQWTATDSVAVRAERSADAPVIFTVDAGQRVDAMTGVVVTTSPGRVRFRKQVDLPSGGGAIHVEPGEDLQVLSFHGEDVFTAAFQGVVYPSTDGSTFLNTACEEQPHRCIGELVAAPESVWWVQLKDAAGRTGWTSEAQKFAGTSLTVDRDLP
jgi:hypothetical protein